MVAVALVVGATVAVLSFRTVSQVEEIAAGREASSQVATQFVRRANNFSSDRSQAYEASVVPLLTTSYAQEWRGRVAELEAYQQEDAVVTSEAQVTGTAVVTGDADSATVLVVADTSVEVVGSPLLGALRWEVDLFEVDGEWRVNDYRRVGPGGVVS
ncbi:hypothetical protein KLP28_05315 [Nocardioidaceae bacterium]|nr:hypothetical protein KLP28_05315 [Nocardioidaceae bacterium]